MRVRQAREWLAVAAQEFLEESHSHISTNSFSRKAVGEYLLLLSLVPEVDFSIEYTRTRYTSAAKQQLPEVLLDTDFQYAHFLYRASGEASPYDQVIATALAKHLSDTASFELTFLAEEVGLEPIGSFWEQGTSRLLLQCGRQGVTTALAYDLTHLVFFATRFGARAAPISERRLHALNELMICVAASAASEANFDLNIEALIAIMLLKLPTSASSSFFLQQLAEVDRYQSSEGWFLSDLSAGALDEFSYDALPADVQYSVFHTTCVRLLLNEFLRSCPSTEEVHSSTGLLLDFD